MDLDFFFVLVMITLGSGASPLEVAPPLEIRRYDFVVVVSSISTLYQNCFYVFRGFVSFGRPGRDVV